MRLLLSSLLDFLLPPLLAAAIGVATPAAAETAGDPRTTARRLSSAVIEPAYGDLAAAARRSAEIWESECRGPAPSRERLAVGFVAVATAWWRIEGLRYGPAGEDFRAERIDLWPERRNATTRGLAELVDPAGPEPTAEEIRGRSAAVQGLPALERLIFEGKGPLAPRVCAVGRAIAGNLAAITAEIDSGWRDLAARAGADEATARELTARVVTDLVGEYEALIDGKLGPLGKTIAAARPDGFEGRRAGAERAALAAPLAGLAALTAVLVDGRDEGATAMATVATARAIAAGLPEAIGPLAADAGRRSQVVLLRDALRSARDAAIADLPPLVGVSVGFNSRDGD